MKNNNAPRPNRKFYSTNQKSDKLSPPKLINGKWEIKLSESVTLKFGDEMEAQRRYQDLIR